MALVTGIGINTHQESIPTPATYFPTARWVRCDDTAAASWATTSLGTFSTRQQTYRAVSMGVAQDVGADWGTTGIVGHARELVSAGKVDVLLMPNEPDLNSITAADYAAWCIAVKRDALSRVPGVLLAGPQLSSWSLSAASAIRVWWDAWVAAGGLEAVDVVAIHPYTTTDATPGTTITAWIADLRSRIGNKPLIFTEFGYQSAWVIAAKGSYSAANMASLMIEVAAVCAALGVPLLYYDGAASLNNDGNAPLIATTISSGVASATQTLTSITNVVDGMFLAFGPVANPFVPSAIRQVLSHNVGAKTVTLSSSVTTTTGWTVVNKDHNSCLTGWASGQWNADGTTVTGLTALGTALAGVI